MKRKIVGFHQDEELHWVADLECGHRQHVRHNPPLTSREWVLTEEGRRSRLGAELDCKHCDEPLPASDSAPPSQSLRNPLKDGAEPDADPWAGDDIQDDASQMELR